MTALALSEYEELRDLRHMEARAAGDLNDWLDYLRLEDKSDRTVYGYHRTVAGLLRAYMDKGVEEFTAQDINAYLTRVPSLSRYIVRSILNSFFEWATLYERCESSPMGRVPKMRQPRRRPKNIYTDEERSKLQSLDAPHGTLFMLLFGTGLRRGEARGLQRRHISLDRERLTVFRGKGNKDRDVGLPPDLLKAVADFDFLYGLEPEEYVWSLARADKNQSRLWRTRPISDTKFSEWYARCVERAGIRYLNPHQTRHTYGWLLRDQGFDLEERRLLMGHESIATTDRYYGHLELDDVADKISRVVL